MRVAYLVARYPAVSQTFVLDEVLALRARGVEVDTFTIRRPPPEEVLSGDDRRAHATTYAVLPAKWGRLALAHARALFRHPARYLSTLAFALRLGRADLRQILWQGFYFGEAVLVWDECRRRGIRRIHAHFANVATDVAMLAARLGGPRWSWSFTMHGPVELADVRAHRLAEKVEEAALVVCITDFARSQVMQFVDRRHWAKLEVVRVGIDIGRFERNGSPPPGSRPGLSVLAVGRLSARKGHGVLIEAIAQLGSDGVDARLTLVGDGDERPELEALARSLRIDDRVSFAGAVGRDEIGAHFQDADLLCLPSFAEGLPVVLMEAMAMELPVVATTIAGVPELVEHGTTGYLVPPGRADAIADAVRSLADDAGRMPEMGAAGRRKVESTHDVRRAAARLATLLEET